MRTVLACLCLVSCGSCGGSSGELDAAPAGDAPAGDAPGTAGLCTAHITDPTGVHAPACVTVPAGSPPPGGWPLVVALHRLSGTSAEALSRAGLSSLASWAIVIAPDGLTQADGQFFNAGPQCCDIGKTDPTFRRDLDWLEGATTTAKGMWTIDPQAVAAVGLSNGGWMASALACDSVGIAIEESASPPMTCDRAVQILKLHGTADKTAFYDASDPSCPGGPPCRLNGNRNLAPYFSAEDATPYGCTSFIATGVTQDFDASIPGDEAAQYTATGCTPGTEVELWKMTGSMHSPSWRTAFGDYADAWLRKHFP